PAQRVGPRLRARPVPGLLGADLGPAVGGRPAPRTGASERADALYGGLHGADDDRWRLAAGRRRAGLRPLPRRARRDRRAARPAGRRSDHAPRRRAGVRRRAARPRGAADPGAEPTALGRRARPARRLTCRCRSAAPRPLPTRPGRPPLRNRRGPCQNRFASATDRRDRGWGSVRGCRVNRWDASGSWLSRIRFESKSLARMTGGSAKTAKLLGRVVVQPVTVAR